MQHCWRYAATTFRLLPIRGEVFPQELAEGVQPSDTVGGDYL